MHKSKNIIYSLIIVMFMVVISVGITYSYFTASMSNGSTSLINVTSGKMVLSFSDNNPSLVFTDVLPGPTASTSDAVLDKSFAVTGINTTEDLEMKYKLTFNVNKNEFSNGSLGYILVGDNSSNGSLVTSAYASYSADNLTLLNKSTALQSIDLGTGYFAKSNNVVHTYHFYIFYIESGTPQDDAGAKFVGNLSLEAIDSL